ncbi:hypothetical protein K402DRAFT_269192 [Aulographum hederae CBS 113979]|uniref:Uncharacterized protein n=1 Tax=Aulographum hederae CBS 113979 TaxID=1176131 RepID=A0A6G1H8A7_9PEZI|nr:hypothetical protein K402DRAFT_269192 [Aulographum hederae CBS 113979]
MLCCCWLIVLCDGYAVLVSALGYIAIGQKAETHSSFAILYEAPIPPRVSHHHQSYFPSLRPSQIRNPQQAKNFSSSVLSSLRKTIKLPFPISQRPKSRKLATVPRPILRLFSSSNVRSTRTPETPGGGRGDMHSATS